MIRQRRTKAAVLLISAWMLMWRRLPVKCLKLCSCCLAAMQFHSRTDLGGRIFKMLCSSPKMKLKVCVQQIWRRAGFHKHAPPAECCLICIWSYWNKEFVNPQSTDFCNMNWRKSHQFVFNHLKEKKISQCRTRTHLRGQCCTTAEPGGGADEDLCGAVLESQMKKKKKKATKEMERPRVRGTQPPSGCQLRHI